MGDKAAVAARPLQAYPAAAVTALASVAAGPRPVIVPSCPLHALTIMSLLQAQRSQWLWALPRLAAWAAATMRPLQHKAMLAQGVVAAAETALAALLRRRGDVMAQAVVMAAAAATVPLAGRPTLAGLEILRNAWPSKPAPAAAAAVAPVAAPNNAIAAATVEAAGAAAAEPVTWPERLLVLVAAMELQALMATGAAAAAAGACALARTRQKLPRKDHCRRRRGCGAAKRPLQHHLLTVPQ